MLPAAEAGREEPHAPALALRHLTKSFGGVRALDDVALTILPGEVHGLLGENGSGKSTVIKILAGYHAPDSGELEVDGLPVKLPLYPGQFRLLGLDFVHQDLGLIPSLSVIENLRVGEFAQSKERWYISWRRERRKAREVFHDYGIKLDPLARIADLRPVDRALLAIVRAVEGIRRSLAEKHIGTGVLILDEPTVFLPRTGAEQLFALVRKIVATGASVLFVSHDLAEVLEFTDRITVLRDGRVVGTVVTAETSEAELVEMIIGRRLEASAAGHHVLDLTAKKNVSVARLTGGTLRDISIEVDQGEVLGLTGLAGSGFEEIPYLLFGAWRAESGQLLLDGRSYDLQTMTPARALASAIALIPADRHRDGTISSLPAIDNITMRMLNRYFEAFLLRRGRMIRDCRALMARFDVRPADPRLTYASFSGGNQQKALLAKWLQARPSLFLLHEPTQGVDVGARQQIFAVIREEAATGTSVICASSDYEQLDLICDRVLVFRRGQIFKELTGEDVTKDRITEECINSMVLSEKVLASSG